MSARLIKVSLVVVFLHIIILSVFWIGFPVPMPRAQVDFIYVGGSVDDGGGMSIKMQGDKSVDFDRFDAPAFTPWMDLRSVDKPRS